jgi:hypothetical protein
MSAVTEHSSIPLRSLTNHPYVSSAVDAVQNPADAIQASRVSRADLSLGPPVVGRSSRSCNAQAFVRFAGG